MGSFNGSRVSLRQIYRFPNNPIQIRENIYWDALGLFENVKKGLVAAVKKQGGRPVSIGLDTWGNDFCLLDKKGCLLENPHSYRDPRTDGIMLQAFEKMPRNEIYGRTGVQFMQHNTLFQLYSMILDRSPLLKAASTYLMIPDLFNFWLTGKRYCEFTNATTTQFFDLDKNTWNYHILTAFDIPRKMLPPVIKPGYSIGKLDKWLCKDLEIPSIPVLAVGTHDTASAVSVVPADNDDYAFLSSGTWSLLGAEVNAPLINNEGLKHNFSCYGGVCNKYLVWKNIQALWLLQECQRMWKGNNCQYSNDDLIGMAEEAPAFHSIIDTDDRCFLTPGDSPARIAEFCISTGQDAPEDYGAIVRCILESLALKYRYTLNMLQIVLGHKISRIYIVGGGSLNNLLNRFTSEATGIPVITGYQEATALGNFMQQLIALGEVGTLRECREIVRQSFKPRIFEMHTNHGWDDAYERFLRMMSSRVSIQK